MSYTIGSGIWSSVFAVPAHNDTCRCTVQGRGGEGFLVNAYPNTNLYDPNTVIPAVRYDVPVGTSVFTTTVESWYK